MCKKIREDFPPRPRYLPRPFPPRDDQLLRDELRRTDDLPANTLLLTRARSDRINGYCMFRSASCKPNDSCPPLTRFGGSGPEMLRLGVSLPVLMRLLGHKDIRMTLRHVQVTQQNIQRKFHSATAADIPGIRQAQAATRHLLEMYRRELADEKTRRSLQRLGWRLLEVAGQLDRITTAEN
jgi:hypothetical protein